MDFFSKETCFYCRLKKLDSLVRLLFFTDGLIYFNFGQLSTCILMKTKTKTPFAESFDKRQLELKNVVLSNEGFIKDTDIKIERAERKARDEQLACTTLTRRAFFISCEKFV